MGTDLLRFWFRLWKSFSSGSGSGSGSSSGSGSGSRQYLAQFSNNKILEQILPFHCQKQHYFPESWPVIYNCLTFFVAIYVKSRSGTVMHSGSAKAKGYDPRGSGTGSTTLLLVICRNRRSQKCEYLRIKRNTTFPSAKMFMFLIQIKIATSVSRSEYGMS